MIMYIILYGILKWSNPKEWYARKASNSETIKLFIAVFIDIQVTTESNRHDYLKVLLHNVMYADVSRHESV